MRCLACGAEMRLEEEAGDETIPVSGFKRQTFKCPVCGEVEQRLAFSRDVEPSRAETAPLRTEAPLHSETPQASEAPLVSLPSAAEHPDPAAPAVAKRVFSKFARISRAVVRRLGRGVEFRSAVPDVVTPATSAPAKLSQIQTYHLHHQVLPSRYSRPQERRPRSFPRTKSGSVRIFLDAQLSCSMPRSRLLRTPSASRIPSQQLREAYRQSSQQLQP